MDPAKKDQPTYMVPISILDTIQNVRLQLPDESILSLPRRMVDGLAKQNQHYSFVNP